MKKTNVLLAVAAIVFGVASYYHKSKPNVFAMRIGNKSEAERISGDHFKDRVIECNGLYYTKCDLRYTVTKTRPEVKVEEYPLNEAEKLNGIEIRAYVRNGLSGVPYRGTYRLPTEKVVLAWSDWSTGNPSCDLYLEKRNGQWSIEEKNCCQVLSCSEVDGLPRP